MEAVCMAVETLLCVTRHKISIDIFTATRTSSVITVPCFKRTVPARRTIVVVSLQVRYLLSYFLDQH
jgi:hypothetical protein